MINLVKLSAKLTITIYLNTLAISPVWGVADNTINYYCIGLYRYDLLFSFKTVSAIIHMINLVKLLAEITIITHRFTSIY